MDLVSNKIVLSKTAEACFSFLSKPENYEPLMPVSNQKFELNALGGFIFQLKGMPQISLKEEAKQPDEKVVWSSGDEKLNFILTVQIETLSPTETQVQFLFHGEFNTMLTMMVKKPLKKFIETLSENLKTV